MEIQVGAILLQILNFGVVVGALTFLLLKPIRRLLEERSRRIEEGQKAATAAMAEKEAIEELKTKIKREAQKEAKEIVEEARKDAETAAKQVLAEAEAQSQEILKKAETTAGKKLKTLQDELQKSFESAVVNVSETLIGESISTKKHQDLIKKGLDEISAA